MEPCLSFKNRLRNLSFAQPNSAISEQCCAPHSTARNAINMISTRSCRTFSALGSGTLSNAVRKSCIGDPLESAGVLLRIHNLPLCKPPQLSSYAIPLQTIVSRSRQSTGSQGEGRARLCRRDGRKTEIVLPTRLYAPELNPDDLVWSYVKRTGTAKRPLASDELLQDRIEADLINLQNNRGLIRSFFKAPDVSCITDS